MNNQDIPADKINEAVARARGWKLAAGDEVGDRYWFDPKSDFDSMCSEWDNSPLTNHNQFHEIWTADIEAKACDVLQEWFTVYPDNDDSIVEYWHDSRYQANRRLWQLRAYCEVMGNAQH